MPRFIFRSFNEVGLRRTGVNSAMAKGLFMKNIYLVGFMGTGKTTVGKILANKLSKKFVETDQAIEEKEGEKIKDIFAKKGESYFRKLETNLLKKLSSESGLVVSCGGGLACNKKNLEILQNTGHLFSLSASASLILERIKDSNHRPLLRVEDPLAKINELLNIRKPYYQKAGIEVNTDNLCPEEVADSILNLLKNG